VHQRSQRPPSTSILPPCCPNAPPRLAPAAAQAGRTTQRNREHCGVESISTFRALVESVQGTPAAAPVAWATPSLKRRLACFIYEGVLLFGVVMAAGFVYSTITQQRHALVGTTGLQVVIFLVLGLYFVRAWSRGGQTLAMQTWQIRLVLQDGSPVPRGRAIARYLLSWLWFLPALLFRAVRPEGQWTRLHDPGRRRAGLRRLVHAQGGQTILARRGLRHPLGHVAHFQGTLRP
jgi:uncharacterized RDD family membrane protein YckC